MNTLRILRPSFIAIAVIYGGTALYLYVSTRQLEAKALKLHSAMMHQPDLEEVNEIINQFVFDRSSQN